MEKINLRKYKAEWNWIRMKIMLLCHPSLSVDLWYSKWRLPAKSLRDLSWSIFFAPTSYAMVRYLHHNPPSPVLQCTCYEKNVNTGNINDWIIVQTTHKFAPIPTTSIQISRGKLLLLPRLAFLYTAMCFHSLTNNYCFSLQQKLNRYILLQNFIFVITVYEVYVTILSLRN